MRPVRLKHHEGSGWRDLEGWIQRRDYASYEEYRLHQEQKLIEMLKLGIFMPSNAAVVRARRRFFKRFRHLIDLLPRESVIVCLGARQGTEVEVLRDLGFQRAIGVDLNPGPANPLVVEGDFHQLDLPDQSVDLVYSNSLDHAFDLNLFFAEAKRVLRPGGYALYDVGSPPSAGRGPAESIAWTNENELLKMMLRYFDRIERVERNTATVSMLLQTANV